MTRRKRYSFIILSRKMAKYLIISNLNFILVFTVLVFGNSAEGAKKCPGFCTNDIRSCKLSGGKIIAYCVNGQACCSNVPHRLIGSCGDVMNGTQPVFFKSPDFPKVQNGDLTCEFKLRLEPTSPAVRIDFVDIQMDGMKFSVSGNEIGQCDSDVIFLKGFSNWTPPPRCGNLTGYSTIIDRWDSRASKLKTLSILAIMSSPKYRWLIRLTQLKTNDTKFLEHTRKQNNSKPETNETPPPYTSDSYGPIEVPRNESRRGSNGSTPLDEETLDFDTSAELVETENEVNGTQDEHGNKNMTEFHTASVVNGKNTKISKVPWQASLRVIHSPESFDNSSQSNCTWAEGSHFCGGSIIDEYHILSASHCFFGSSKRSTTSEISSMKVVLGDTNKCLDGDEDPKSEDYEIESIAFHYGYDDSATSDDVVVIRLKNPINLNNHSVKAIKLAESGKNFTGQEVLLSGWGATNNSVDEAHKLPDHLQSTKNLVIGSRNVCQPHFESMIQVPVNVLKSHVKYSNIFDSIICTAPKRGTAPANAGGGDSGGPLVVLKEEEPIQIGIVSYGIPMPKGDDVFVDFYQSVSFYRRWIDLATEREGFP